MAIQIASGFNLRTTEAIDSRLYSATLAELVAKKDYELYDGIISYAADKREWYTFRKDNVVKSVVGKWRKLYTNQVSSATVNSTGNLVLTFSDGETFNCGSVKGAKGDPGQGFNIAKIYTWGSDAPAGTIQTSIVSDYESEVLQDGMMITVVGTGTHDGISNIYLINGDQDVDDEFDKDTLKCNLSKASFLYSFADMSAIQGEQGEQGEQGDKGDPGETPEVTHQVIAATETSPAGIRVTLSTTDTSDSFSLYNGVNGANGQTPQFNITNLLDNDSNVIGKHVEITTGGTINEFDILNGLNGTDGVDGTVTFNSLTDTQIASLKGEKGDPFRYSDFTESQLNNLKGADGSTPTFTFNNVAPDTTHKKGGVKTTVTIDDTTDNYTVYHGNDGTTPTFFITDATDSTTGDVVGKKIRIKMDEDDNDNNDQSFIINHGKSPKVSISNNTQN